MALERRQFIGLTTQEAASFDGLDRELTVDTTNGTLRVHTEDSPHGNRLAKYSELDAVNSLMLSEFDSVRGQINDVDDELSSGLAAETSARENADATLSSSIGNNTTAIDGLTTSVAGLSNRLATVETALPNKQDQLVSGTNLKTINNLSLLGSGNIDIQGGGSQTKVIRQYVERTDVTWTAESDSQPDYGQSYYGVATITNSNLENGKRYLPVVLFSNLDPSSSTRLFPVCQFINDGNGSGRLFIYAKPTFVGTPVLLWYFNVVLIEITNDNGDSISQVNNLCRGITNGLGSPHDIKYSVVSSLPAQPDASTFYLIPES